MDKLKLSYGSGKIDLKIPKSNLSGFIKPRPTKRRYDPRKALPKVLELPVSCEPIEIIVKNKKICVTIEDYTRSEPHEAIVSALSQKLNDADMVQYIVVTGTHNPADERNLRIKAMIEGIAEDIGLNYNVAINASREKDQFDCVGTTSSGTEVWANKKALDCDVFIAGADMKPHYFAGYSAANKHFLPGICAFDTVRVNHCGLIKDERSNYGRHPWHYDSKRNENPLVSDMIEAMNLIAQDRLVYALAMINDGDILWSQFGDLEAVTRNGIKTADEIYAFSVNPVKYLVVSPGGIPEDSYLYSAQRAPELTLESVQPGGQVLLLSECALGIHTGENQQVVEDFHKAMMTDVDTLSEMLDQPDVKFHTYKAYRFKRMLQKVKILGYSALDDDILKSVNIQPVDDPQAVLDQWLKDDPYAKILAVDKANKLAVYAE
ncbi:DUF2088 domain-containing protein [Candidatus Poribacteria bacterium]|nr:DUF2088 domain-containing protein [Candidatus Poribacteria bacterium]